MTARDHAISEADLGPVDYWPEPRCTRCDNELPPDSDTGLCARCEAAEDVHPETKGAIVTLTAFECPACGHRDIVKDDDRPDTDDRGRPRCSECGMPMLPVTLVPANRDEHGQVYARK